MGIFVLSTLIAITSGAYVSVPPKDTVVEVGSDVGLVCEAVIQDHETDYLEWKEYITSPGGTTIFNSFLDIITDPERYLIRGEYDLVVKSVRLEDGGMYSCKLSFAETTANNVDLIVIEKPQLLLPDTTALQKEHLTLTCSVSFGSRRPDDLDPEEIPGIKVWYGGQEVTGDVELIPGKPGAPDQPSASFYYQPSAVVFKGNIIVQPDHNGQSVTCEARTSDPSFATYVNQTISVKYPVDTIIIEPRQDTYNVGDVITCGGNGNPTPLLMWSPSKSPTWASGRETEGQAALLVKQSMVGQTQHWYCIARNIVDGFVHYSEDKIQFNAVEAADPSASVAAVQRPEIQLLAAFVFPAIGWIWH